MHETIWMPMERQCGGTVDGLEAGFGAALIRLNGGGGAAGGGTGGGAIGGASGGGGGGGASGGGGGGKLRSLGAAPALPDGRMRGKTGGAAKYGRMPHPSKMLAAKKAAAEAAAGGAGPVVSVAIAAAGIAAAADSLHHVSVHCQSARGCASRLTAVCWHWPGIGGGNLPLLHAVVGLVGCARCGGPGTGLRRCCCGGWACPLVTAVGRRVYFIKL